MSIKKHYILILFSLLFLLPQLQAKPTKRDNKQGLLSTVRENKDDQHINIQTLTVDENVCVPIVESPLAHRKIREYMAVQERSLQKLKQYGVSQVEFLRGSEVIKITIPMEKLFYQNSTKLLPKSELLMRPIARYGETYGMYHILIVAHSDNSGSIEYNLNLTISRAEALYDNLKELGINTNEIVTYGMGGESPIADNFTMENRQKNRRVEIYLIPGEEMIKLSLKGRLEVK